MPFNEMKTANLWPPEKHFFRIAVLFLVLSFAVSAVPLQNWRRPFYTLSAIHGDFIQSPGGLFWDDMTSATFFDSSVWPDTASYNTDHWTLEPSVGFSASNDKFISGRKTNFHIDLMSDFRYGILTVRNVLDVDQSSKSDPGFVWHKEMAAAGRIEEAYAQIGKPGWFVRFGRMNRNWGPMPDRSLVLSDNPYSYDALEWQISSSFFEFRHLVGAFPIHASEYDTRNALQLNRYFCAHTLDFMIGKWASLGVTETVVFARSGFPDLQYINPFSIYSVINSNQESGAWGQGGGNLMVAFSGRAHPFTPKALVWGQVAVDDIQIDDSLPMDQEPAHWGLDAGASYSDFLPVSLSHYINMRYRYLSKWIYTVHPGNVMQGEQYTYLGRSLGFPIIDGDELEISAAIAGKNMWGASLGLVIGRQDTGSISTLWPVDSVSGTLGYRSESPLSERPGAEKTVSVRFSAYGYFRDFATLSVLIDNRFVRNKGHVATGSYEYDPVVFLSVTAHYSDLFLKFRRRGHYATGKK
jgi:hypothetical protein